MSQFPQAPPPGPYVPPNTGTSSYQQSTPYGGSQQPHKGGVAGFGKMLDQAVTQGKPMLNKLGKTISSKLGNKPSAPGPPQHLQSYQNYQEHYQQQAQPQAQQQYGHQPQQQWQQQQNVYSTPQLSPYSQANAHSSYATPASGHSGQNNYFSSQALQTPPPPPSHGQSNVLGYNSNQYAPGQNTGGQLQHHSSNNFQSGQIEQSSVQGQPLKDQYQQAQVQQGQPFEAQQTGVVSTAQSPVQTAHPISAPPTTVTSNYSPNHQPQQTWLPPTPSSDAARLVHQSTTPASNDNAVPIAPTPPPAQYGIAPVAPVHPEPQHLQHQQPWTPASPMDSHGSNYPNEPLAAADHPAPHASGSQHQSSAVLPQHTYDAQPASPPQNTAPASASTNFIAELPADMANLGFAESYKPERPPSNSPQTTTYQAFQPPKTGAGPRAVIPRRAVSTSSLPYADPWRIADTATELPTREFYVLADLLFDALDRKCEPQSTGLLEASKILESWKVHGLAAEAASLFAYDNHGAFAKLWALEGIPHILVPCQPSLTPSWNFQPQLHAQEMRVLHDASPLTSGYPVYMPALNRAGWYKHLFVELLCEPMNLDTMLSAFCSDTYKPAVLNQPDVQRQDTTGLSELAARVNAIHKAVLPRVCQETAERMHHAQPSTSQHTTAQQSIAATPSHPMQYQSGPQENQGQPDKPASGLAANALRANANWHNTTAASLFSV